MNRPLPTLFMLMSVDGKTSTGSTDALDVDQDFPHIEGVKEAIKAKNNKNILVKRQESFSFNLNLLNIYIRILLNIET